MRLIRPFLSALASSTGRRCTSTFTTHTSFRELVDQYDAFILDQFGVMHNGFEALHGAVECVEELHKAGKALIILSNTSAPSHAALKKLPKFGFDPNHFVGAVTSGEEASKYVRETFGSDVTRPSKALFITWDTSDPDNPRLTALPEQFLAQCGNVLIAASVEEADFLLLHGSEVWLQSPKNQVTSLGSFIDTGNFDQVIDPLLSMCVQRGLPAVCANPDFVVQTPSGGTAFMPGRIAQRYQEMGGHCTIFGKPHSEHFVACLKQLGLERVAHVGDSLHHDIAGASRAGVSSVFVSSGIHFQDFEVETWGELPQRHELERVFDEAATTPTHVVGAFRL